MASPSLPAAARHGRRTYLLDRDFQLRYTLAAALLGALCTGCVGLLAWAVHRRAGVLGEPAEVSGATLLLLAGAGALGAGAVLGLFGLLFTHRVAGPVHVMNLYVAALAAGHYPRLRPLRKRDALQAFFARFSEAVERIRAREAEEAEALGRALTVVGPLLAHEPAARGALEALEGVRRRKAEATLGAAAPRLESAA